MADPTEISVEDAENFLQDDFNKLSGKPPVEAPAEPAEPAEAPAETPEVAEPKEGEEQAAAPEESATPAAPEAQPNPYDWIEKIEDKEVKDKIIGEIQARMQAEHRIRSDNGRVAAFQRQARELKQALAQLKEQKNKPPGDGPPAADAAPQTPEEWNSVIEADPVLAKAVQALLKSEVEAAKATVRGEFQEKLKGAVEPIYTDRVQQGRAEEQSKLLQLVPNAYEVIQSQPYQYFINNVAPPGLRELAVKSTDHRDAVAVLRDYASWMIATGQAPAPSQQQPDPAPAADTSDADRIAQERANKLKTTTPGAAPSAPVRPGAATNNLDSEAANDLLLKYFADIKSGVRVTK